MGVKCQCIMDGVRFAQAPACSPLLLITSCLQADHVCVCAQVDYVLNKTKEDLFASPVLSGAYESGMIKGDFALPSNYKAGEAPKGWEKPEPVNA